MVVKAKPPKEDPETKARRERAEARAEERRVNAIREDVTAETDDLVRRFGRIAGSGGGGIGGFGGFGLPSGGSGGSPISLPSLGGFGAGLSSQLNQAMNRV